MKKVISLILVLAISCLVLGGCDEYSTFDDIKIKRNGEEVVSKLRNYSNYDVVELNKLTDFEWDNMYCFTGYIMNEEIEKTIGTKWNGIIDAGETMDEIYFLKNGRIVGYIPYTEDISFYNKSELFKYNDNSKLIMQRDSYSTTLGFFDDKLIEYSQASNISKEIVGTWRYFDKKQREIMFSVSKNGIISGSAWWGNHNLCEIIGIIKEKTAFCKAYQNYNQKDEYFPNRIVLFEMKYQDGKMISKMDIDDAFKRQDDMKMKGISFSGAFVFEKTN